MRFRAEVAFFVGVALKIVRRSYTFKGNQVLPLRPQCGVCGFLEVLGTDQILHAAVEAEGAPLQTESVRRSQRVHGATGRGLS